MLVEEHIVLPTQEQQEAIELFADGRNLRINAFAGAGKTTTLRMIAEYAGGRRGLYIPFGKSTAAEAAARFPESVECRTQHSLAYRATPSEFHRHKGKMTRPVNANAVAEILNLKDASLGSLGLTARTVGFLVLQTFRRFAHGAGKELLPEHVPYDGRLALVRPDDLRAFRHSVYESACRLWEKMCDPADPTPLGYDGYLKRWALGEPVLDFDFILLDEAQDSNAVILDVLARQRSQIVYVGDQHQQIYEWRGAVNAMQNIETPNNTHLTESFRFGQRIAEAASRILARLGEGRAIRGNPAVDSRLDCQMPRAILCRTNAEVICRCLDAQYMGTLPHIVGGTYDLIRQLRGVSTLKGGRPCDVPEFFGFKTWAEVVSFSGSPEGQHLRSFVRIVDQHGEHALISALGETSDDESRAGVVISTAHKAKGREWETVLLADDFTVYKSKEKPEDPDELDPAELRLLYVAMTRAKRGVKIPEQVATAFGIALTEPNPQAPVQ